MAPKYPNTIPTLDEIFKVTDFVDWVKGEEWDDIRAELRAIAVELGTLPKGGFADVKTRLDDIYPQFHDRGDSDDNDFALGDLTTDNTWRDLNLSAVVPAGAKAVLLRAIIQDDAVSSALDFGERGNTNKVNTGGVRTQVAGIYNDGNIIVACDASRYIEYRASNLVWTAIFIRIRGWWM